MVKVWELRFLTWFVVGPFCGWLSASVTVRSAFWGNIGVDSVMPVDVSILVVAIVGTITCWNQPTTTFCVASSSNAPRLIFPCFGRRCSDRSCKGTSFFKSSGPE